MSIAGKAAATAELITSDFDHRYIGADRPAYVRRQKLNSTSSFLTGGCLCGAVRYEIRGASSKPALCHCASCRRSSGAPVIGWATIRGADFSFTAGEPALYRSSEKVERSFCSTCGTQLTYGHQGEHGWVDVTICSMDDPEQMAPMDHIWVSHRLSWMEHIEELPCCSRSRIDEHPAE